VERRERGEERRRTLFIFDAGFLTSTNLLQLRQEREKRGEKGERGKRERRGRERERGRRGGGGGGWKRGEEEGEVRGGFSTIASNNIMMDSRDRIAGI
jgi:hypothetical protein